MIEYATLTTRQVDYAGTVSFSSGEFCGVPTKLKDLLRDGWEVETAAIQPQLPILHAEPMRYAFLLKRKEHNSNDTPAALSPAT